MTDSEPRAVLFERLLPISLVLAILLIAFVTLYPFLPALLWGAMVAIAIDPAYRWLVVKLGGRRILAAWLTAFGLVMVFVLPIIGLARTLIAVLPDAFFWFENFAVQVPDTPPDTVANIPAIGPKLKEFWQSLFSDVSSVASHFAQELKSFLVWFLGEAELLGSATAALQNAESIPAMIAILRLLLENMAFPPVCQQPTV